MRLKVSEVKAGDVLDTELVDLESQRRVVVRVVHVELRGKLPRQTVRLTLEHGERATFPAETELLVYRPPVTPSVLRRSDPSSRRPSEPSARRTE